MSKDASHPPPALALWFLEHFCPGNSNKEALTGDLLERFGEGRTAGWFWRQVLIAILVGVLREMQMHWLPICHAITGTVLLGYLGKMTSGHPAIVQLWMFSKRLKWPWSTILFDSSIAALFAWSVLPILVSLLLVSRAFDWTSIRRTFGISFLLIVAGNLITSVWVSGDLARAEQ